MPFVSFLHVKIDVQDLDRSLHYYGALLGFKQVVRYDRADGIVIVQISPTGEPPGLELWYQPPLKGFRNDRLHVAFQVRDIDSLIEQLRAKGVGIETEPFQIGHERIAFLRDPDGYLIELNETTSSPGGDAHEQNSQSR